MNTNRLEAQRRTPKMGSGEALFGAVVVARDAFRRSASAVRRAAIPAEWRRPLPLRSHAPKVVSSRPVENRTIVLAMLAGAGLTILLGLLVLAAVMLAAR